MNKCATFEFFFLEYPVLPRDLSLVFRTQEITVDREHLKLSNLVPLKVYVKVKERFNFVILS